MSLAANVQAWRLSHRQSINALAAKAGLPAASLEAIEAGELDPSASTLQALAAAIGVPVSWLFGDPRHLDLMTDPDPEHPELDASIDPVRERILGGTQQELELYVLLTTILQGGDPRLRLAVEASLRSLARQATRPTVPWQSRPAGHFEPPND